VGPKGRRKDMKVKEDCEACGSGKGRMRKGNKRGKYDQSTVYACMEISLKLLTS
jgi:hypothetical protein